MKYKRGDKVMVLPTILRDPAWGNLARKHNVVGKIVTITSVYDVFYITDNNKYSINFGENHVVPSEINWRKRLA